MNNSIPAIFIILIVMGSHYALEDLKRLKRSSGGTIDTVQSLSQTVWNTLMRKELAVSLLAITRDYWQQEKQIHLSLANYESAAELNSILKKELVFITHGFISDGDEPWMKELAQAYLNQKNVTVFIVDWGTGANIISYSQAVENSYKVAKVLIDFITYLIDHYNVEASGIHLIGYSLGAHMFGFVGKGLPGINRITGLDPAEKNFENDSKLRLSRRDGKFVDIIHTNTIESGYGLRDSVGHIDFYFNGGETQPGCTSLIKLLDPLFKHPCSHYRSVEYFIESIKYTDCVFVGFNKNINSAYPYARLGLDTFKSHDGKETGDYYIVTNSKSPYCKI